ncbi:hypothetical protein Q5P01_000040 [Channa striata]|uniref:Uncharacterized protein n=1 Tax=Channa striata TaxID=64152 RepID=A0AA88LM29_CHASR|nr:hypothetical protein Q5P01_000040 [Channa striata]
MATPPGSKLNNIISSERYIDLNDTLLFLRLKITNADGTDLAVDEPVGIINYPLNTIFNYCDSQFSSELFCQDSAGAMDSHVVVNRPNRGLTERAGFSAESFQVLGPLHADIFFCERLLLTSVDIRVKLTRASDAFCLMHAANRDYRLHVLGASLFVKKVTVAPLNTLHPLSRINVKTFSIPATSRICSQENLFFGTLPNYVVLGLVNHETFTGRSNLNPFNFIHCDLEYLAICQDGCQIPAKPFQPQFENNLSVREYYNLFSSTGQHLKDQPLCFDRNDFAQGYTLFAFNLAPDEGFPLPQTTTLIVYACYDSILEIDSKRNILVDYYQ